MGDGGFRRLAIKVTTRRITQVKLGISIAIIQLITQLAPCLFHFDEIDFSFNYSNSNALPSILGIRVIYYRYDQRTFISFNAE